MSNALKIDTQFSDDVSILKEELKALHRVQAVIEFNLDGTILTANQNFLSTVGYSLDEIQGQHHRMFCEAELGQSLEYRQFWEKLSRGEFVASEFKRVGKSGKEIWINASYNPIFDSEGRPFKVIKFATDITAAKMTAALGSNARPSSACWSLSAASVCRMNSSP